MDYKQEFPVLYSGASGLYTCTRDVSVNCVKESKHFLLSFQDLFVFNSEAKDEMKLMCPQSPSFIVRRPPRPRERKRDMGTRMQTGQRPTSWGSHGQRKMLTIWYTKKWL